MNSPVDVRRRVGRTLLALAALFLISLPAVTPRINATDEIQYFSYLRSLWFDGDVAFENEYRYFVAAGPGAAPGFVETHLERTTETGHRLNFGTLGSALLWAPLYALADLWVAATGSAARDGFSFPYVAAVAYASALYGFAALVLSLLAAVRVTGASPASALAAAVCVWLGTPLLFYMYLAPGFAHATSAFSVALFVVTWLRVRQTWNVAGVMALGATGALMVMVREQDAFLAAGPAVDFCLTNWRAAGRSSADIRRRITAALAGLATFALCMTPQLLAYRALNGYFRPSRLVARKMTWSAPHAVDVLFSPEHGFFFWTPLAPLAVAGLVLLAARGLPEHPDAKRIGGCALLMIAMQVYVSGSVASWTVSGAFGQRRFVSLTILLVLGLAALWRIGLSAPPWTRMALAGFAALAIWWNIGMMALFGAGLMDRQRLELRQNAYDVFVTLPRMAPEIVYRYFTHRESFYRTRPPGAR